MTQVKVWTMAAALMSSGPVWAQALETTVCDILANPTTFDGKVVQIKGQVTQGFEAFLIQGGACNQHVNAIWLSYPQGTNGKAGPIASITVRLSRNGTANGSTTRRTPVKLDKNKEFKQFDSALSAPYSTRSGMCLGCGRNTVTATFTGRLDAVEAAGIVRDRTGKLVSAPGFGNLNRYRARLVLQRVSDVEVHQVDFSVETSGGPDRPSEAGSGDPVRGLRDAAKSISNSMARQRLQAAADAFGKEGEQNGVIVGFSKSNEVPDDEAAKASVESPDGMVINLDFDMDRLKDSNALSTAISHMGTHIADIRDSKKALGGAATPFNLEWRAWQTTAWRVQADKRRALILPGGFTIWGESWAPTDVGQLMDSGITKFLAWSGLQETSPHNPWQD
jgi:hypothetical protein